MTFTPGDFILVNRRGLVPGLIRLGQRIRRGQRPWARFSHAALIVSERGDLIEALTRGVVRSHISDYAQIPHVHIRAALDEHDQGQAVAFAESCVGQRYGFLVDFGIALRFLTPGRGLWWGMNGTEICSGLVAQALCRGWANFPVNPASMAPAELGAYYRVPTTSNQGGARTMPTLSQVQRFLTLTVLPVLAGAGANWLLTHLHFLAAFHATQAGVAGELTQLGVFAISAGLAFLASHHILKGSYVPPLLPLKLEPVLGELKQTHTTSPVTVNVHNAPADPAAAAPASTVAAPSPAPVAPVQS